MGRFATLTFALLAACGGGGELAFNVATPLVTSQETFFNEDVVRRFDIEIDPADLERREEELVEQLQLVYWQREYTYFDCTVRFQDNVWHHVGIRFKGSSSLEFPYRDGRRKLPFKLDFDEFEDDFPETNNQRFFGLKKLNFNNHFKDPSMQRDLLTLRLLRDRGVHAPRCAPVTVYVNDTYYGLYLAIEQVDKRFLVDRFGNDDGNLYKPRLAGGDLTRLVPLHQEKKTNEDEGDWSDLGAFIDALADPATDIEAIFEVESFVTWLAVSVVLCHLDSHIAAHQNYYLYNDPATGKWVFISWDHNESYGSFVPPGFTLETVPEFDTVTPWQGARPLIERVLAIPAWRARFDELVDELRASPLGEDRFEELRTLFQPYALIEEEPFTLLRDPLDLSRNVDRSVISTLEGFRTPGLRDFLNRRRAYLSFERD